MTRGKPGLGRQSDDNVTVIFMSVLSVPTADIPDCSIQQPVDWTRGIEATFLTNFSL